MPLPHLRFNIFPKRVIIVQSELSSSLGLVKFGVYKHYESKKAIWNALLDQMIACYVEPSGSPEHLPPVLG